MIPVFSIDFLGEQSVTNFGDALQMFLDIFPETFVEPFANGNALQVIVISIVLGIAILVLDTRAEGIKDLFNQLNSALYIVMEWVSKLLPVMVFLLILETVWSENVSGLIHLWKPLLAVAAFCAFMILVELLTVAVKFKVSPFLLAKKLLSSNLIAFATSCAMASYSVATETCEKELGVAPKITKFGLPLGLVAYMPAISVYYLIILFYGLERYDISCSIGWLFIASITVALLSIATPPISGGSMACFAILLAQMAVPMETIAFALVMNVIAERFCTVANLSMLELELVLTAEKTGLLNREAMRQPRQRP